MNKGNAFGHFIRASRFTFLRHSIPSCPVNHALGVDLVVIPERINRRIIAVFREAVAIASPEFGWTQREDGGPCILPSLLTYKATYPQPNR